MSTRSALSPASLAHERDYIEYAKESLIHGEHEGRIVAAIIQHFYPKDPAQGYDYARYILAEARFALGREKSIHQEQSSMKNGSINNGSNNNRDRDSEQYKRDWSYALRAMEKGDTPQKVIKDMATFRKDLPDPQKYAETTVARAQQHLQVHEELVKAVSNQSNEPINYAALDKALQQSGHLEFARQLYQDGANRQTVTELLKTERRLGEKRADSIATEGEARFFAERDLNYAVRARERGEGDDRIIPKIAEYRQDKVENPQEYARAIVAAADKVLEAERQQPHSSLTHQHTASAQQQYRSDLRSAVFQLEQRTPDQVRVDISERRPEKAYESLSYRVYGKPAHNYAVAVTEQAEKIREVTDAGRNLEETLDVAEREFGRHLRQAMNLREAGHGSNQVVQHLTEKAGTNEHYARTVFNQAHTIGEQQRQNSIRPEVARHALEHAKASQERTPVRTAVTVDR